MIFFRPFRRLFLELKRGELCLTLRDSKTIIDSTKKLVNMWITLKQKNRQCALESRLFFLLLNPKFIDLTVGWVWLLCLCRQNHYKKLDNQRIEKFHFYISGRSILHPLRSGNQIEIYQRNQKDNSDWLKFFSNREHPFLSFQKISWF